VWLHIGAFGPRRIDLPDAVDAPRPPWKLIDNAQGILDLTDLVFVDPVGTGFSRVVGETAEDAFHGVGEDVEAVAEFIVRWLARHNRWASPKFLAGESYGTTRSGGLAANLHDRGVQLSGLVLVSVALNFQTFVFEQGNDTPDIVYLPGYAACSWYHRCVDLERWPQLHGFLDEVREFALDVYAPALLRGSALPADRKRAVAEQLHAYTGLPVDALMARDLRIEQGWYSKTVLGQPGRTIGRLDARYVGPDMDPHSVTQQRDPSYDAILGPFSAAVNDWLRGHLKFTSDDEYAVLSLKVNQSWRWRHNKRLGYVNTTEELRQALISNPRMLVIMANGIYDLATPFSATEHNARHLGIPAEQQKNVRLTYYEAGHMMYLHPPSLVKFKADLAAFYADATKP
jgi:carboxypeptidase C (cathepsin A)